MIEQYQAQKEQKKALNKDIEKTLTSVIYIKNICGSFLSQWVFHSHCDIPDLLLAYIPRA